MSNYKREPLLSDDVLSGIEIMDSAAWLVRERYERLITEGKLRLVEEAIRLPYAHASERNVYGEPLDACSLCNGALSDNTPNFCPGCGNKIKKP